MFSQVTNHDFFITEKVFFMKVNKIISRFKRKQDFFLKNIRGFVNSELVKTCHEHVKKQENRKLRQKLLK